MSVEKWNLDTVKEFIDSKYDNIELINIYSKRRKNGNLRKFITISNGERIRDMELNNFLKRGCDFYEKTDKKITKETISSYLKNKYPDLNIEVLKIYRKHIKGKIDIYLECKYKGKVYNTSFGNIRKGFSFGEKIPIGEKLMIEALIEKGIKYEVQKQFEGMKYKGNLKFDFYLPDYNTAIEIMGIQHFEPVKRFGGNKKFEETIIRDNIKREYCKNNGIKLIEIDRSKEMTSKRNISFKNKCLEIINELIK